MGTIALSAIEQKMAYNDKNELCVEGKKIGKWWGKTYFHIESKDGTLHYKTLTIVGRFLHLFGYEKNFHRGELKKYLKDNNIKLPRLAGNKTDSVSRGLLLNQNMSPKELKKTVGAMNKLLLGGFEKPMTRPELKNEEAIIDLFNQSGLDVNTPLEKNGVTALYIASKAGSYKLNEFLIDKGANINVNVTVSGYASKTPLQNAIVYRRDEALIKLLLEKGADVNSKNIDGTPVLNLAIMASRPKSGKGKERKSGDPKKILQMILEKKPDVNFISHYGMTALHTACEVGDAEVVQWLLDAGADASLKNDEDKTALDIAREWDNATVVKLLEENIIPNG